MNSSDTSVPRTDETPRFEDDDGNVFYGAEAIRQANAYFAEIEARNRAYVQRLTPEQRKQLERVLRERATPPADTNDGRVALVYLASEPLAHVAGPRQRSSVQRSSGRSGDSNGDDGPGDPPRYRRLTSAAEIDAWRAERRLALDRLIGGTDLGQLEFPCDDGGAA
jgi:hypothetical protein